jgi:DNA (cytosine-5)-methyltransferase 1
MKKIKLMELFAGYGGASFGLQKARVDYETVGFSEIDKYAIQCYNQNHVNMVNNILTEENTGEEYIDSVKLPERIKNYGDITQIDPKQLPDFDLLTGGFPCQSFSVAGKGLGELDTRGTLFNDIIRIAEEKQPRYMLLENVKGLMSKRHKDTYNKIRDEIQRIGYYCKVKILNSKNYGIPQNRERVWFVCFRKDLMDEWDKFEFPKEEELKLFLKDVLEEEVDKKYYLSEKCVAKLSKTGFRGLKEEICSTITTENYKLGRGTNCVRQLNNPKHSNNRVYSDQGISPTLRDMSAGGNRQPFIKIKNATKKGYLEGHPKDGVNLEQPNSKTRRGRIQKNVMGTLQCNDLRGVITEDLTIRKLTPTECFRLMGFLQDEINLEGLSDTQRYKLAGNGWDINLASKIFSNMFKER